MKRFLSLTLISAVALIPTLTFADSVSGSAGTGTGVAMPAQTCLSLSSNLGYGMRGSEVASLQTYLLSHSSFTAGATGYFGPLTRAAVMEWQKAHNISPTGYVGPISRGALTCTDDGGGNPGFSVPLNADPSSGTAPLSVDFSAAPKNAGQYIIQFGDGEMSGPIQSRCLSSNPDPTASPYMPLPSSSCEISTTHTYKTPGTYSAVLEPYVSCMYNTTGPRCMIAVIMLGQTQVTVR